MKKRKRTEKSKYKHESTGEHCTAAAYVAEIMCKRNAENRNEGSLPYKFWNTKKWKWTYQRQVIAANKMIEQFGERALVRAVNSPEFNGIFSLNHPKCYGIIKRYSPYKKKRQRMESNKTINYFITRYNKETSFCVTTKSTTVNRSTDPQARLTAFSSRQPRAAHTAAHSVFPTGVKNSRYGQLRISNVTWILHEESMVKR